MKQKQRYGRMLNDRGQIDLLVLIRVLWDRAWIIGLTTVLVAALSVFLSKTLIAPTYESSFTAFVNNRSDASVQTGITNADTSASESLAHTYAEIVRSRPMLEKAAKRAGVDRPYKELDKMVSTSIEDNTQLVDVRVLAKSSKEAFVFAKAIADIAPKYLSDIVEGTSMKIVAAPVENTNKVAPNNMMNGVMGGLVGFLVSSLIIMIKELSDTKVKDSEELEEIYGYSVVGIIPAFDSHGKEYS